MNNYSIVLYETNKINNYSFTLNKILISIRDLNELHKEIISGIWDSNIKYRTFFNKNLTEYQNNYLDPDKWINFIFISEKNNFYVVEDLLTFRLRLILLLFWRDIVNKLSSDTIFKLQLKLIFSFTTEYVDQNTIYY